MATKELPVDRGRRKGGELTGRLLGAVRDARVAANMSCRATAEAMRWSQTAYRRFEQGKSATNLVDLSAVAAVLGLDLSADLFSSGKAIRDKGHQALITRFRAELSEAWRVVAELPLPNPGDPRTWDLVLRIPAQVVGVEAETRIRDVQRLVRHIHQRQRDGGADVVVLLLANTRVNRDLLPELLEALGPDYATPPRQTLRALRGGLPLPGSGVVLV
jgi:transcriptional regulator with XRE-family HTH domain